MYRFGRIWATVALVFTLGVAGCQTAPTPQPEMSLTDKSNTEILYHAIVTSFEDRGLGVDIASKEKLIVISPFKPISERLRRRYAARIIRMRGGASALRIKAEHQRKHGKEGDVVWRSVDSPVLAEQAKESELKLARAIERRFQEWKKMREE